MLSAGQELPGAPPGVPATFTVVPGVTHQTVESPIGAKSVSASSYGSSPSTTSPRWPRRRLRRQPLHGLGGGRRQSLGRPVGLHHL